MKALFCLGLVALFFSRAIAFADDFTSIAKSETWLALLHYQDGSSQITDSSFFLSQRGSTDSQAELDATIAAFREVGGMAQCRFPARMAYIQHVIPNMAKSFPRGNCPELDEFVKKVPFDKVSLAFATEHIPNPTTMMGHLFVKIEGDVHEQHPTHSLSFFADLNKVNSTAGFIAGSLWTGTDGVYILEPYKARRDDYLYAGQRSIWEYELNLNAEQRRMLGLHIWEMKGINVAYDLRENNCGSAILRLLMVADPEFERALYKNYVTPADILRKLKEQDALADQIFIPSRLYATRNTDGADGVIAPKEDVTGKTHATTLTADYNSGSEDGFYSIGLYPAYNLLMQRNAYSEQEYEVKLFGLQLGISDKLDKLNVQRFDVISFQSYLPITGQDASLSNALDVGLENSGFGMKTSKVYPKVFGGFGWTINPVEEVSIYGMLHAGYSYFGQDNVLSIAPELGAILREGDIGKAQVSYQKYYNTAQYKYDARFMVRQSFFLTKDINLNARYEHVQSSDHVTQNVFGLGIGFSF